MRLRSIIIILLSTFLLWGCSDEKIPFVYRIDVQQGNVVTQDMLVKLRPGQDKRQVSHIMGTPLIIDVFHDEQWIYLYSFQKEGGERAQRRISIYFEDDKLSRISGDIRPAEPGTLAKAGSRSRTVDVPPDAGDEDGGFLRGLIDSFDFFSKDTIEDPAFPNQAAPSPAAQAPADAAAKTPQDKADAQQPGILQQLREQQERDRQAAESADTGEPGLLDKLMQKFSFGSDAAPVPDAPPAGETSAETAPEEPQTDGAADEGKEEGMLDKMKKMLGWDHDDKPDEAAPDPDTP